MLVNQNTTLCQVTIIVHGVTPGASTVDGVAIPGDSVHPHREKRPTGPRNRRFFTSPSSAKVENLRFPQLRSCGLGMLFDQNAALCQVASVVHGQHGRKRRSRGSNLG